MSWTLDNSHTVIGFSAKHMMITTVRGTFTDFTANLNINPDDVQNSSLNVAIQLDSINSGDAKRDGHLRSPDFFAAEQYPTMTFKSTRVVGNPDSFKVYGDLTIKDVTKPIVLNVSKEGEGKSPFGGARVVAYSAEATINRKDWGLNWNVALEAGGWLVSENIKISLDVELVEQATAAVQEDAAETNLTTAQAVAA